MANCGRWATRPVNPFHEHVTRVTPSWSSALQSPSSVLTRHFRLAFQEFANVFGRFARRRMVCQRRPSRCFRRVLAADHADQSVSALGTQRYTTQSRHLIHSLEVQHDVDRMLMTVCNWRHSIQNVPPIQSSAGAQAGVPDSEVCRVHCFQVNDHQVLLILHHNRVRTCPRCF
jgi:hypothetical protein